MSAALSRRAFLRATVTAIGGVAISLHRPALLAADNTDEPVWLRESVRLFVRIDPDGSAVIGARGAEIGQGVRTSLPMLVAEELDIRWARVRVEQLPYGLLPAETPDGLTSKFGPQGAGGSTSIPDGWLELRQVGAKVRQMLLEAAAREWNVPVMNLRTRAGFVVAPDGRELDYGALAAAAGKIGVPAGPVALKQPGAFTIIGRPAGVADARDIVTGAAEYGIDGTLPDALVAVIDRCPYFEGGLAGYDAAAARKVPGVRHLVELPAPDPEKGLERHLAAGVAVVADDTWSAMRGREALATRWQPGAWKHDSTTAFEREARERVGEAQHVARQDGDVATAVSGAAQTVSAVYYQPFLAHCTMEPQNATIALGKDRATLIASLQSPSGASRMISTMTGIDRLNIDIRMPRSGGGFGRRLENDFVAEAVHVAQAVGKPVKLVWQREDDMQHDWYRPAGAQALDASLDDAGRLISWSHRVAASDRRFRKPGYGGANPWIACLDPDAVPAGCVDNYFSAFTPLEFGLPRGWWRGPLPTFAAFANQSFMDEVAVAAGADPVEFRLAMLGEPRQMPYRDHGGPVLDTGRLATVLRRAAERIGYGNAVAEGHGVGVAAYFVFGGYAAHAMEVSVVDGRPVVHRCVCAIDVGQVVNPLGLEAQAMGATLDGLSTALALEITVEDGRVQQRNFPDYPLLKMADAPDVDVVIVASDAAPAGAGEMGIPTVAPALANAIFAATGRRIRRLPIGDQLRAA